MLSHASSNEVGFYIEYLNEATDSAKNGIHYHQDSTRKFIPVGETSKTIPIRVVDVPSNDGNKTFTFTFRIEETILGSADYPADAQTVNNEKRIVKTVTIIDNEPPGVEITNNNSDFTLQENGGDLVVNYVLGGRLAHDVTFEYDMVDVTTTRGSDFDYNENVSDRTVTISATGSLNGSFTIPIRDDTENEGNETFTLELSNLQGASVFVGSGLKFTKTVTIVDNEQPTLRITNSELSVIENIDTGMFDLNLKLSGPTTDYNSNTNLAVIFDYALNDIPLVTDSATFGTDYTQPISRRISISEGETDATISIPITDDATAEGNERFNITLNISSGAKFDNGLTTKTETITIHDNDIPTLSFQTASISAVENADAEKINVSVNLTTTTHQDVTFDFDMSGGTATKGLDYLEEITRSGTITAGSTSGTFSIPLVDDLLNEGNETFTLSLTNIANAVFASNVAKISKTVTIVDNELPLLLIKTENFSVDENDENDNDNINDLVINFELSGPAEHAVTFKFDLTDDTATKGQGQITPKLLKL